MARALILDSEALSALAEPRARGAALERARAVLTVAFEERALVVVPAPVLAEVCRGRHREASILRVVHGRGITVAALTEPVARLAGRLLFETRLDSSAAVDAFVVATAAANAPAIIATHDPDDLRRLASHVDQVTVFSI